jgi:hypothetical protein
MLFTVTATFSDFTAAYEQYVANTPTEALTQFLMGALALTGYDQSSRSAAAGAEGHRIVHAADGKRGLWIWHLTARLEHEEVALYGGCVVQTDLDGPVRATGTA